MNLNPFKTYTLTWWQTAFLKAGLLALEIAIGAYWHLLFGGYLIALIAVAVATLAFVTYFWAKQ